MSKFSEAAPKTYRKEAIFLSSSKVSTVSWFSYLVCSCVISSFVVSTVKLLAISPAWRYLKVKESSPFFTLNRNRFKSLPNGPRHLPHLIKVNTIRPSTRRASNEKAATAARTQKRPTKSMALRGRCSFPPQVCFGNHRSSIDWTVLFSWCFKTDREISCSHGMPCLETANP